MSWKTELIHAAGSTTVPQVLIESSHDRLSTGHILSFIHNKKRRANRKTHSQTAKIEKDHLCRLRAAEVDYQRGTVESYNSEMVSKLWYLDLGGNLTLQSLRNHSYFFGLCPDTVLSSPLSISAHASLVLFLFTCFTLHLLSALMLVLPYHTFNSLFFTSMFLLPLIFCGSSLPAHSPAYQKAWGWGIWYSRGLVPQEALPKAVTTVTMERNLGWWTAAGAGGHIYVSFHTWLSYNSCNNTEGTWVLYKDPPLLQMQCHQEWHS